jgi:hypothetical protein
VLGYQPRLERNIGGPQLEASLPAGRMDERTRDATRILVPLVKELAGVKPRLPAGPSKRQ